MSGAGMVYPFISAAIGVLIIAVGTVFGGRLVARFFPPDRAPGSSAFIVALMFAIVILFVQNLNQFAPAPVGFSLLLLLVLLSFVFALFLFRALSRIDLAQLCGFVTVGLAAIVVVGELYEGNRLWLLEGPNHDSLVYYEGMKWALQGGLLTSSNEVLALWGLNTCGHGGSMWIGHDCGLYRGGAYSLAAWVQFFSPYKTGNGLFAVFAYVGVLSWISVSLLVEQFYPTRVKFVLKLVLSFVVLSSTAGVSALINSNLATALSAASISAMVAVFSARHLALLPRVSLAALFLSISTHFYAESVFYAGLIAAITLTCEFFQERKRYSLREVASSVLLFAVLLAVAANYTLVMALRTLMLVSDVAGGGDWWAWYIDAPIWTWIGSFLAVPIVGSSGPHIVIVALATLLVLVTIAGTVVSRRLRPIVVGVTAASILAVVYVEWSAYRYGEHKVLQVLGTSWSVLLALCLVHLWVSIRRTAISATVQGVLKGCVIVVAAAALLINGYTLHRGRELLIALELPHAIRPGLTEIASRIRPGDKVLLNDYRWIGVEKFHKSHYVVFFVHDQGGIVVTSAYGSDALRGGYYKNAVNNTLRESAEDIRWLITSKSASGGSAIFHQSGTQPVLETPDYALSPVDPKRSAVVVPAEGWYHCEPNACWTRGPYVLEAVVPETENDYFVEVHNSYFRPPQGGEVTVTVNGNAPFAQSVSKDILRVPLVSGYNRVVVTPTWNPVSPSAAGVSGDTRNLFASVTSVRIVSAARSSVAPPAPESRAQ